MVSKSLAAVSILSVAAATAGAAIRPFWRVNPIPAEAIAASGGQLTPSSHSVSLMVELTGGSLCNVAGLDLDGAFNGFPTMRFFQRAGGGASNNDAPTQDDIDNSPGGILAFDTRVQTAVQGEPAATPGRLNGTGTAQIGNIGLLPTSGANRTGTNFNVAWGATPNNGGPGIAEIARITIASGAPLFDWPIAPQFGLVADSLNPNTNIPLPAFPGAVPEPVGLSLASVAAMILRRKH